MTPEEVRQRLGLPEEARLTVVMENLALLPDVTDVKPGDIARLDDTPSIFAFAATGRGPKTKIVAHGYGPSVEEAIEAMQLCKHPRAKSASHLG